METKKINSMLDYILSNDSKSHRQGETGLKSNHIIYRDADMIIIKYDTMNLLATTTYTTRVVYLKSDKNKDKLVYESGRIVDKKLEDKFYDLITNKYNTLKSSIEQARNDANQKNWDNWNVVASIFESTLNLSKTGINIRESSGRAYIYIDRFISIKTKYTSDNHDNDWVKVTVKLLGEDVLEASKTDERPGSYTIYRPGNWVNYIANLNNENEVYMSGISNSKTTDDNKKEPIDDSIIFGGIVNGRYNRSKDTNIDGTP